MIFQGNEYVDDGRNSGADDEENGDTDDGDYNCIMTTMGMTVTTMVMNPMILMIMVKLMGLCW